MSVGEIFETQDGSHSIFSKDFKVPYHSKYGAIQETQHVFIDAALRFKAVVQKDISILDIGFGTGLNAFMTFLEAEKRNLNINYVAAEAYPISISQAKALNFSELLLSQNAAKKEMATFYSYNPECAGALLKMHESPWEEKSAISESFMLTKLKCLFQDLKFDPSFDIIYFDAFAPNAQPELWEESLLQSMYDSLLPDGILVTYCAKGVVKRTLKSVGFQVEKLKGPPGKREMTRATK